MSKPKLHTKSQIMEYWVSDPVLQNYAINEVGLHESLMEDELKNAFYFLTIWIQGKLHEDRIDEMMSNGCEGSGIVLCHIMKKAFPRFPKLNLAQPTPEPQPITEILPDLF
jgi:hypothetical protein